MFFTWIMIGKEKLRWFYVRDVYDPMLDEVESKFVNFCGMKSSDMIKEIGRFVEILFYFWIV